MKKDLDRTIEYLKKKFKDSYESSQDNVEKVNKRTIEIKDYSKISYETDLREFDNEVSKDKFIHRIEKVVRNSFEYRDYISFLKSELDLDKCFFFYNLNHKFLSKISIEIHHSPFTLYDITKIVYDHHLNRNEKEGFNILKLSEEIVKIHYQDLVGLIPVTKTVHDLIHTGSVVVHPSWCRGSWKKFYEIYQGGFSEDYINKFLYISNDLDIKTVKEKNSKILERFYTEYEIEDRELNFKIEENRKVVGVNV